MRELNLLPIEIKDVHKKRRNAILGAAALLGIIAVIIVSMLIPKIFIFALEKKENDLKEQVTLKQYISNENLKLRNKVSDFKGYFSMIDSIRSNNEKVTFKLKEISEQLPPDVAINSLNYNNEGIVIVATSKNYVALCNFTANLQLSKKYKNIYLASIVSDNTASPKYRCTITLVK